MNWYLKVLQQYADFKGRARRKEYWMFFLFQILIIVLLSLIIIFSSGGFDSNEEPSDIGLIILGFYFLATLIPTIAVSVRRLHDTNRSGWWYLLVIIPYIGRFVLLIFNCMDSYNGSNKWGENPKGVGNDTLINQIGTE
ncbi:DUF805 domain-containing protein [Polaribacter vadi]|uniref:DUF805 domain-containing protein n=1 Tax=Polaribacter TaxID=52959 RepID=UPI001C099CF5|nr:MULTISPECIES: DUF805 domain-containing protein [Polaribacter]MBU3012369.1 DUF805 domain-containing protein [Polaribacter vadi]MDO6742186.1 DUF805 domain-containing protein [Polaribacter sp. 1_MG-2023]